MAERLANHFACYRPASDLFLQLLDMDKTEDAKFMLAVSVASAVPLQRLCDRRGDPSPDQRGPAFRFGAPARPSPHLLRAL